MPPYRLSPHFCSLDGREASEGVAEQVSDIVFVQSNALGELLALSLDARKAEAGIVVGLEDPSDAGCGEDACLKVRAVSGEGVIGRVADVGSS